MGAGEDLLPRRQDAYIRSRNHSGAFVLIDLMAIRLQMGGYCLRNAAAASSALISWAVEGSENGDEFETLDTRENCAFARLNKFLEGMRSHAAVALGPGAPRAARRAFSWRREYFTTWLRSSCDCLREGHVELAGPRRALRSDVK